MILVRILRNLKAIYRHMNNDLMAFQMIEWILALAPDALMERKERGLIYEQIGNTEKAVLDLEEYLVLASGASDTETIQQKILVLKNMSKN